MSEQIFVQAYSSKSPNWHIGGEQGGGYKTLCGHSMNITTRIERDGFMRPFLPTDRCPLCDKRGDYEAVYEALKQYYDRKKAADEQQRANAAARQCKRSVLRRQLVKELSSHLEDFGGEIIESKDYVSGGNLVFQIRRDGESFDFKISVSDWTT